MRYLHLFGGMHSTRAQHVEQLQVMANAEVAVGNQPG